MVTQLNMDFDPVANSHSQTGKVFEYMRKYGSITPLDAMASFGCTRLAARIGELKALGVATESHMITVKNRYGQTCRVAEYRLVAQHEEVG